MDKNSSKKVFGADNQQERIKIANWICGFVDGEGCFSVSIIKNKTTKSGIKNFFECGNIFVNKRYDNHNEDLYRYCIRSLGDLSAKIIPFFESNKLRTYKNNDFLIFKEVILLMLNKKHLKKSGKNKILRLISKMNRKKKRF